MNWTMKLLIIKHKINIIANLILRPKGRISFLNNIPKNSKILDVGCGNNSAFRTKSFLPNSYYVGIDIGDYNNKTDINTYADEYILTDPEDFVDSINSLSGKFDAIISSHNLEHCNDRNGTLDAIINKLNSKGKLYLSFPSEKTINFPKRDGCLDYYDDPTHKDYPPDFKLILEKIEQKSLKIIFKKRVYKPFLLRCYGYFTNLLSYFTKKHYTGMWEWWGFESIIVAQKNISSC